MPYLHNHWLNNAARKRGTITVADVDDVPVVEIWENKKSERRKWMRGKSYQAIGQVEEGFPAQQKTGLPSGILRRLKITQ